MPWDEMETHTQEVQCCLPYIIFCNRGFFFSYLYNSLLHFKKKTMETWLSVHLSPQKDLKQKMPKILKDKVAHLTFHCNPLKPSYRVFHILERKKKFHRI